jgi:hypothetical protein
MVAKTAAWTFLIRWTLNGMKVSQERLKHAMYLTEEIALDWIFPTIRQTRNEKPKQ